MTIKQIGAAVRKARGQRSVREVAGAAGLHRDQVAGIEAGNKAYTIHSLLALCKVVGLRLVFQAKGSEQAGVTCRASVLWFAEQMELALRRNDHKGGWEAMGQEVLAARCGEELEELRQCWDRATGKQVRGSSDIIAEAADVANFAMMVADLSGPKHGM